MLDEVLLTQVGGRRGRMVGFLFVVERVLKQRCGERLFVGRSKAASRFWTVMGGDLAPEPDPAFLDQDSLTSSCPL